jgi:hypothetical protein
MLKTPRDIKPEIQKEYQSPIRRRIIEVRKSNLLINSEIRPKLPLINTPPQSHRKLRFDSNDHVKKMLERRQERLRFQPPDQQSASPSSMGGRSLLNEESDVAEMINEATEAAQAAAI